MQDQFNTLKNFIDGSKVGYKLFEHEPVFTSYEAAKIRGVELKTGVKALVFKVKSKAESYKSVLSSSRNYFILVLVPGDKNVDTKKLREVLNAKDAHLATPQEVLESTRCEIGSVHPFGNLFNLPVCADKRILGNEYVNFNAGLHEVSITMKSKDFIALIKPRIEDIAKE